MRISVLFLFLVLSIQSAVAQESPYQKQWVKVDALELDGQVKSALTIVDSIRQVSIRQRRYNDYVKASVYRWKFLKITEEDVENSILQEIEETTLKMPIPQQAILKVLKARLLTDYYSNDLYTINQRSKTTELSKDIGFWDGPQFIKEIVKTYKEALYHKEQLLETPIAAVDPLVLKGLVNRQYVPTLYDLIAQDALRFYRKSWYGIDRPAILFEINDPSFFGSSEAFRALEFETKDTLASSFNAVMLMQEIEATHAQDADPTAFVYAQLQRLQFATQYYVGGLKNELYEEALYTLLPAGEAGSRKHTTPAIQGVLQFELASHYVNLARIIDPNNENVLYKGYYLKAKDICKRLVKEYPNTEFSVKAQELLKDINQIELFIQIKANILPGKANRMFITYRNVDTLNVKIVKIPFSYELDESYHLGAHFWGIVKGGKYQNRIVDSLTYILPNAKDVNKHTTEVLVPKLPHGRYLVYADNKRLDATNSYAFGYMNVSQIGYTITDYPKEKIFRFYDRSSGVPLENVKVATTSTYEKLYNSSGLTDAYGEYKVLKRTNEKNDYRNNRLELRAIHKEDTLRFMNSVYPSYERNENKNKQSKVAVFLDRGIYRPGQTLYFKGILLQRENKKSTVVSQEHVRLFIESSNGDTLLEKEFITNEYGSFSGEFEIPENVLTGAFRIRVEKDNASSEFWNSVSTHNNGYQSFKVEAYKRPTFEINFDTISKAYQPNDSITIKGNAKAFLGSNITEADGTYTITRNKVNRYWYYYRDYEKGRQLATGVLKTDAKGGFEITFVADFEGQSTDTVFEFLIAVDITDLNGETRNATKRIKISSKNLVTTLTASEQVEGGKSIEIAVANKNLNDVEVVCDNTIKIYKLETPNRVLFDRLWKTPEYQQISKEAFQEAFPNELYDLDSIPESKGVLVYEGMFKDMASYKHEVPTSVSWEAGTYLIEHHAQSKEGTSVLTEQRLLINQPTQKYLPKNELFSYEVVNENPRKDGYLELALKTSLTKLPIVIDGFYKQDRFYKDVIVLNGKETIKIPLDPTFEKEVTLRLKYAKFERFFHEDIPIDLSIPINFLEIETKTFRSKLYPDSKETWSFKIKDSKGKKAAAEVLASMYDKSLDTYAKSTWNSTIDIRDYNYNYVPSIDQGFANLTRVFRTVNRERTGNRFTPRFDRITFFGLDFHRSSYRYSKYIQSKRWSKELTQNVSTASTGSVVGIVLDVNGSPIPKAMVRKKGSGAVTTTDSNGEFFIDANLSDVLVVSYEGNLTREIKLTSKVVYIVLEKDPSFEELIITAQGIKREKKALGYAVSVVEDSEEVGVELLNELAAPISGNALGLVDSVDFDFDADKALLYNSRSGTKTNAVDFKGVKIRKNLNETAFFYPHLRTNRRGEIKFTFDAPQLLTQWRFRLLAHTKDIVAGKLEKDVITQKDVSLVPNTPRFLREGDVVELSAKIANLTAKEMEGAVQLQLFDALTMKPIDSAFTNTDATKSITIQPNGNTSVFWRLEVPSGVQVVTYRMMAKAGSFSDGEENILPVLSNRMMMTESVPFLIRAGEEQEVTLDPLVHTTSKTLTHQKFALEYTSNPSWYALQSLPYLMEFPHECSEQTFSRMYANSLSAKVLNSNPEIKEIFESWKGDGALKSVLERNESLKSILVAETPWLRDAQSETERKKRLGLLFDIEKNATAQEKALTKLKEKQNENGGFPWFSGGRSNYYITRHIVSGMGHLQKLGVEIQAPEILENAIDYLDIELEDQLKRHVRSTNDTTSFYRRIDHLHFLYTRSFFMKEYPLPVRVKSITDKALQFYNEEWLLKSTYEKGLLALVNHRLGNREMATKILTGPRESAVQSDINGMYWKDNRLGWYWYQSPIETHALLMEAFDEILQDQTTIEELKIWLLQQKRKSDWQTTKATAAAVYALLMTGDSFVSLEDTTQIKMQTLEDQDRVNNTPKEVGTGYRKIIWNKDEVTTSLGKVIIKNEGTTAGYGGMYWQYFEDIDKIKDKEGAILNMSKSLFLVTKEDATQPLEQISQTTVLELGQTVRVRLTIKVKSDMEFVHLKDMRASGLEPVDVLSKHTYQDRLSYYQSTRDTATHFFFDTLPMGTYVLEYDLRVNNKGQFSNGISTIQSMYAPEFSNHTAGMQLTID